ncbi:endonuclease/exonuclease/phosphatase family protein [Caulobacter sp. 17J80-11]|uniref:endonuclease/exonuclease/phosphatase family protein n=1 Tax=Caulobacter sp. 17J80-11 TaxID=2763502 RepID=UPI001653798C|nr:endonuclease/exonuclease/phosphatase family protein [Caulobacter sp. 17J80-11]MBC6981088.1 endonuclease/exonuclease/phosphatase family protein [Caulobacter sp. 17J80-11]
MPRIMTYNVHRCVGVDRKLDVERIAAVIADSEPDIVCLQELDVGRARTQGVDQAHAIAKRLEMTFHFHPAMRVEEELYGDAVLTHLPERLVHAASLPGITGVPGNEPRGALWVAVDVGGVELQVLNTHLGLVPREQRLQAAALVGREWLGHPDCRDPVMLVGDFNATSVTRPYARVASRLRDAQKTPAVPRTVPTFPSGFPVLRIDHCFISPSVRITGVQAPFSPLARMASDHLPLVIDFELDQSGAASPG